MRIPTPPRLLADQVSSLEQQIESLQTRLLAMREGNPRRRMDDLEQTLVAILTTKVLYRERLRQSGPSRSHERGDRRAGG
jgi:hypothetical protein